jgi:hypothetical protein
MFWRIRYAPDQAFIEYLTDSKTLVAGSVLDGTAFIDYFPHDNTAPFLSGPVRDGIMYGLDMVPAGRFANNLYRWPTFSPGDPETSAVDYNFIGSINLKSYNTNGSQFPANWTVQDHPDNPIDLPWSLEIGCTRCGCVDGITWPNIDNWHYDPANYYTGTVAIDPESSTLVSTRVTGCCQSITANDLQSLYWPGDEAEPNHAATCPPDCVVWVSDVWPTIGLLTTGGGARSIPGASLPSDAPDHPAVAIAAAGGAVAQLDGWSGKILDQDVARASRGDSASIDNVDCIWLVNVYSIYSTLSDTTISYGMTASSVQWLVDWLALPNKTLIIDAPWKHVDWSHASAPSLAAGYKVGAGNQFLTWIGSSLSLYAVDVYSPSGFVVDSCDCVSTQLHSLAPDAETLFSGDRPGDGLNNPIGITGGGVISHITMGITGGTTLYELDCVMRPFGASGSTQQTHPCVAVEDLVNGSRIITGSISIDSKVNGELDVGLIHVPQIGNMIARAVA